MFRIIDLTSSETVKARGYFLQVKTNEYLKLKDNEVGIIIGKHKFHQLGISCFGGIVNPNWEGNLTIEFNMNNTEITVTKNDPIAHVIIMS